MRNGTVRSASVFYFFLMNHFMGSNYLSYCTIQSNCLNPLLPYLFIIYIPRPEIDHLYYLDPLYEHLFESFHSFLSILVT